MRRHFRLGIIKILGPATAALLLLFGAYQWLQGQPWTAAAGAVLASLAAVATWLALRRGDDRMDALLSLSWLLGSALACHVLHNAAVPWLYLAMMSNFAVVARSIGLACNATLIVIMLVTPGTLPSAEHAFSLLAVSLLITGLGYLLSLHLEGDRQQLEQMASHDALTGLPNRRMLERSLTQRVADPRRRARRHGLVVLDIDHFKVVNDLYGHAAGDRTLAELAALLRFEVRPPDEVFRFGGEEFVVVARLQSRSELAAFSKRLHQVTREALRGPGGDITVSLGAAMLCDEVHWQDWFSRADAALYQAKNGGRDTYVIADDLAQE
ncbi:GGDEF domain-containing protein [Xanthomonas sp. AM6]|uniref:GGDEF domain-containing protein n=1 Tax=Xanthomonas sp. AM6 TaxID=2982531 RepID=UPI0021D962FE|nr:GGDEF domain-containing protein [Xanthomonas sp. AM6]UYB54017.1 GGDEF domain-containing protein [Xanthomonas sp. AM6]